MRTLLTRLLIFLGSSAIGLFVAQLVLDGVRVSWLPFIVVVVIFAVLQAALTAVITPFARDKAPALVGGVGLVSTFLALLISNVALSGLSVRGGPLTWLWASLIVWLATMLATMLLPKMFGKGTDAGSTDDSPGQSGSRR